MHAPAHGFAVIPQFVPVLKQFTACGPNCRHNHIWCQLCASSAWESES